NNRADNEVVRVQADGVGVLGGQRARLHVDGARGAAERQVAADRGRRLTRQIHEVGDIAAQRERARPRRGAAAHHAQSVGLGYADRVRETVQVEQTGVLDGDRGADTDLVVGEQADHVTLDGARTAEAVADRDVAGDGEAARVPEQQRAGIDRRDPGV